MNLAEPCFIAQISAVILELGLASSFKTLEEALWAIDVRIIIQLSHAVGIMNGTGFRWANSINDDSSDLESKFNQIKNTETKWLSEQQ